VSNGTTWNPYTLQGNNAYPAYSSALASLTLSSTQLSSLSLGTHYAVSWDWLWDATANCYKGPGLNQCNTGTWRVQSFSLTSSYAYSQSSYYAYSQASYYAYSQSAYTGGSTVRVNSGGPAYTDTAGNVWSADTGFTGGVTYANTNSIAGTADPTLYHSERYGAFQYALPVTNGSYSVTLKFAETILTGAGQRVFNVTLNGATVLSNFDIYASAGGMNIAIDKTFPVTVANGQISLNFIVNVQNPKVNAIQIVPAGTYAYSQSSYYAYSQGTYYVYSQSSYYAYSQSAYYAYSQSAYTGGNAVPATYFGLHDNFAANNGGSPFPLVSFGATRFWDLNNVTWSEIETANGVYNWTALDNWVATLSSHGVSDIIWTFGYTPLWAAPQGGGNGGQFGSCYPPVISGNTVNYDSATMRAFITALATRYNGNNGHGLINHYETWNEPGGAPFYCGTLAQLVAIQNDVHDVVKAANPNAVIHTPVMGISGSTNDCNNTVGGPGWPLGAFMTANGTSNFDVVDVHLYPYPAGTYPEVGNSTLISNALCGMSHFGISSKPLWDTESSWYPSIADQVAYVARHYLYFWSRGVIRSYWYSYDTTNLGDLFNGSTLTTTGIAYQQVYNWMVGSTMTSNCAASGTVWTCGLKNSSGVQTQAVWNTAGSSTYTVPSGYAHYKDLAGNTTALSGSTVTIGIQPILLVP